jgi:hypothetical protein
MDSAAFHTLDRTTEVLESMERQLATIDRRLHDLEGRIDTMEQGLEAMGQAFARFERTQVPGPSRQGTPGASGGGGWPDPRTRTQPRSGRPGGDGGTWSHGS